MPLSDLLADQVAVRPLRNYTYVTVGEGYSGGGYKIGCALFTAVRVPETHSVTLPAGNSASSLPRVVDAPTPRLQPARVPAANVEDSTAESPDAAEGPVLENVSQCATSCTVPLTRSVLVVAQLATCLPRRDYDSCFTSPTYAARVRQNTGTFAVRPGSHQGCLGRRRTQHRPIERSVVICYRFFLVSLVSVYSSMAPSGADAPRLPFLRPCRPCWAPSSAREGPVAAMAHRPRLRSDQLLRC